MHDAMRNQPGHAGILTVGSIVLCLCVIATPLLADDSAPPPPLTEQAIGNHWIKVETYLHDPQNRAPSNEADLPADTAQTTLPSLGHPVLYSSPVDLTPAAAHTVNFSALPPMFERRHSTPVIDKPKVKTALTPLVPVTPAIAPAKPQNPALCDTPKLPSKQAAAMADDRATLNALRQAVQDLKLEKDLDFLMPQKTGLQQTPTAPDALHK